MNTVIYTGILSLLWVINLFNGTGLDSVYHVTTYAKYIIIGSFFLSVLREKRKNTALYIEKSTFFSFIGMIVIFLYSSEIHGNSIQAINYLWIFVIVYLLSLMEISESVLFFTGLIYGGAGFFILYIYNYGTILAGWNENSIAMIGMHSFLIFSIFYFKKGIIKNKIGLIIATIVFAILIQPTDSRSGILFLILGAMFALEFLPRNMIYGKQSRIMIVLMVPLIIALIVVAISSGEYMEILNIWSYEQFQKPIFNGRDELWNNGFDELFNHFFIGTGNLSTANWHNSAITCLVAYGSIGYILWVCVLKKIIEKALPYIQDSLIQGCIIAFCVLYLQQSVELGFISENPSMLPYIILGLMLGRVNYLYKYGVKEDVEDQYYCTNI